MRTQNEINRSFDLTSWEFLDMLQLGLHKRSSHLSFNILTRKKKRKLITVKKKIHPDSIHNTKCEDFLTVSTTYVPLYQLIIEWHHCPRWLG